MIFLRFIDGGGIEGRLIRFGCRWWCSHVEFIKVQIPDAYSPPYAVNMGTAIPIETLGSRLEDGVQRRPPDYCKPRREEWWTAAGIDDAYKMAESVIGSRYDMLDILGFAAARDWHKPGSYICSALVAASFAHSGNPLVNAWMPIHRVSPRDLLVSPLVQHVGSVR